VKIWRDLREVKFLHVTWRIFQVKSAGMGKTVMIFVGEDRRDAGGSVTGGVRKRAASHVSGLRLRNSAATTLP